MSQQFHPSRNDPQWLAARMQAYMILFRREWRTGQDAQALHRRVVRVLNRLERKMGLPV